MDRCRIGPRDLCRRRLVRLPRRLRGAPSAVTAAARARYRKGKASRYLPNKDGLHVDSEHWFGHQRRIRNLSDRQRQLVSPKIDRSGQVSC
jgi:hypothetical protein